VADFFEQTLSFKLFKQSLRECVYQTEYKNLSIVPSSRVLAELQPKLEGRYKILKLAEAVNTLMEDLGFDEVLFDTPPAHNFFSTSALIAADRVLIPFDCDAFSAEAVHQVMELVEEIAADHNPKLTVEGVVINQYQAQAKLPLATISALLARGYPVLTPYLSSSIAMRESHAASKPLVELKPGHKLVKEFKALAAGLLGTAAEKAVLKKTSSASPKAARKPHG